MAMNLITDVMQMATPPVVDRIAAALGVNDSVVREVLTSSVPAIFAGLVNQAATPGGLNGILSGIRQATPNLGDSLGSTLTGGVNSPVVTAGTGMLRSVLGDGVLNTIIGAISRNTGVNAATGGSLVAVAGQMAMSALARRASGLDAASLGNLLSSQASLFQASLPASLATALGGAGAMAAGAASRASASAKSTAGTAASAARDAGRSATATTTSPANRVSTTASGAPKWLMWVVPLVIVAAAVMYFLGHKSSTMTTETTPAQTTTTTAPAQTTTTSSSTAPAAAPAASGATMVDSVDVQKTLGDSINGLTTALFGVTDAASAQAAIPRIQDAAKGISTVSALTAKFSPDQKKAVAATLSSALPTLKGLVAKVEAIAGAGDLLKPVIDPVVAQLEALAKA